MSRPNILVFLSDDHGQWASRPYGNRELVTPTLDYLARIGARMENAFTPCPVCSPARASFHTGRIPSAHGIHDHIGEQSAGAGHPGIAGQTSLAEVLQGHGYETGLVGKWHLKHFRQSPSGWETWFSNATGTNARFGAQPFYEGRRRVELYGNHAHHLADRAVRFLRERDRSRPFYLFVGFSNTHAPHTGEPERWVQRDRECSFADLPDVPTSRAHGRPRFHYPTDPAERREAQRPVLRGGQRDRRDGGAGARRARRPAGRARHAVGKHLGSRPHERPPRHSKGNGTTPQNFLEESIRSPRIRTRSTTGTATPPAPAPWPSSQRAWTSTSPATKIAPAADSASPTCPSTTPTSPGG